MFLIKAYMSSLNCYYILNTWVTIVFPFKDIYLVNKNTICRSFGLFENQSPGGKTGFANLKVHKSFDFCIPLNAYDTLLHVANIVLMEQCSVKSRHILRRMYNIYCCKMYCNQILTPTVMFPQVQLKYSSILIHIYDTILP